MGILVLDASGHPEEENFKHMRRVKLAGTTLPLVLGQGDGGYPI